MQSLVMVWYSCTAILVISNEYINEFINDVEGTYAQIDVASGPFVGRYLISIQRMDGNTKG